MVGIGIAPRGVAVPAALTVRIDIRRIALAPCSGLLTVSPCPDEDEWAFREKILQVIISRDLTYAWTSRLHVCICIQEGRGALWAVMGNLMAQHCNTHTSASTECNAIAGDYQRHDTQDATAYR